MADSPIFLPENTVHPTRDHNVVTVDFGAARAKRAASGAPIADLDAELEEAFQLDELAERKLTRARVSPEALAELRVELVRAMTADGAEPTARASVLHSVLYAMVRELLDQRACARTVAGAWNAYQARAVPQSEFEHDIGCIAEFGDLVAESEILCNLAIELGGVR